MAEPPTDLTDEDSSSDALSRLRAREALWQFAVAEGMAMVTVGLILIHTAWPRSGLIAGFPALVVLYPAYRWARSLRLEDRIAAAGTGDQLRVTIVDRPFVITAVLALVALALDTALSLLRG